MISFFSALRFSHRKCNFSFCLVRNSVIWDLGLVRPWRQSRNVVSLVNFDNSKPKIGTRRECLITGIFYFHPVSISLVRKICRPICRPTFLFWRHGLTSSMPSPCAVSDPKAGSEISRFQTAKTRWRNNDICYFFISTISWRCYQSRK